MTTAALSVSDVVRVSVNLAPTAAKSQNLSTMLVLDDTTVIDTNERYRIYSTLAQVVADFGTSGTHYACAALYFGQKPQPAQIMLGRWAKAASKGRLVGAPRSGAALLLATWTAITTGSFTITKDGGAAVNVTGLNFSAATSMSQVAAIITAGLTGAVCTYNTSMQRFEIESNTTGATSSVAYLTNAPSGTPIAANLGMLAGTSGAYLAPGQALETAASVAALFDQNYGKRWYALTMPSAVEADHLAVAAYIEGTSTKHLYGISTQQAGALVPSDTTNIGYLMKQLGYDCTLVQYSASSAYSVASLLGRAITVNYQGNATVITLKFKQEPGIAPENLTTTQAAALKGHNINVFVEYDNDTSIIQEGVASSGNFIDIITASHWLAIDIQIDVWNLLYTSTTKIPQTDEGGHLITTRVEARCSQAVTNGMLAPGVWNSDGFGTLSAGDFLAKGFYVYMQPLDQQVQADREARKAPPIKVAGKLSGAFHSADIEVSLNR